VVFGSEATAKNPLLTQITRIAGIVVLYPFLTLLFNRLNLTDGTHKLLPGVEVRALSALFALTNHKGVPDPLHLTLLGLRDDARILVPEPLTVEDHILIEGLLSAVIAQWDALGATSINGLQEVFLIRDGTIAYHATGAHLSVASSSDDMLLDRLPWALGPISLPWMTLPCQVNWRRQND
jgi:hypothetical protein